VDTAASEALLVRSVEAVSAQRLLDHIAEFARRRKHAGTDGELESLRYVERALAASGYRTETLFHDAYISLPGAARLAALGREHRCITHSFSQPGAIEARLVDVGDGDEAGYASRDARGAVVLVDGIATPASTIAARRHGALAQLHVSPHEHLHEMCVSPVWGSPDDHRVHELPRTVVVTVARETGDELRQALAAGDVTVQLEAEVDTGWRPTPILIGELDGPAGAETFVLLSGHHDTWHYGVMDNGGANATMLEVARVCALARERWRRGLRVAFWSGHSQGRYSSSAWYADVNWEELDRRAVVHVNVDSTGGRGNTIVSDTSAAAELQALASEALEEHAGQDFSGRRMERAGDQSFWGIGVPSIFGNMSEQPAGDGVNAMGAVIGGGAGRRGGGTGWWWHTPHDTADKIDVEILVRDTRIYQHALWRLLTSPVPPLDFAAAARELADALELRQHEAGEALDLSRCLERARAVEERAMRVNSLIAGADGEEAERLSELLRRLSRALVPISYTRGDRFSHDPALAQPPLPALADTARLAALDEDERRFLVSRLVRAANRVAQALDEALAILAEA
jgi:hypothetical protein